MTPLLSSSTMRNLKINLLKAIIYILAFLGVGYISSAVSQVRAENFAALELVEGPMQNRPFYIASGDGPSQEIFNRVGAKVNLYSAYLLPNKRIKYVVWPSGKEMPSVDNGGRVATVSYARIRWPFLVNIAYSSTKASLSGGGGTRFYLCLFGLIIQVKDEQNWVS